MISKTYLRMSIEDVRAQEFLLSQWGLLILFILLLLWFQDSLTKRLFSYLMDKLERDYNVSAERIKRDFFKPLQDIDSKNLNLRNKGLLSILEIGVGTGANLKFFPKNTVLTVVDNNPYMEKYFNLNRKKHEHIHYDQFIFSSADSMTDIQDGCFDVVVATLLLCSVPDVLSLAKEIHRVLVPGGKFFFMEHCQEEEGTRLRKLQEFLDKMTGIWPYFTDGCHFSSDPTPTLRKVFPKVESNYFLMPITSEGRLFQFICLLLRNHVQGVATKE